MGAMASRIAITVTLMSSLVVAGCAGGARNTSAGLLPPSPATKAQKPSFDHQQRQMDDLARDGARLMQDAGRLRGGAD